MAHTANPQRRDLFAELVDRTAAAELLGVSPRTLDRWHLLREGPPRILVGRQVRYRVSALEAWLLAHETTSIL
ncbi:helix-turn-helix domain-containing protein [Methylobacterium sp. WL6]|nr:helix-turn-helix domain-containing protein [Methylobacterium sp. WL6]